MMKTKKGELIFCVGVLINAVSSELLFSTDALNYIPNYTDMQSAGNDAKSLMSTLINPDYPFKLLYNVDKRGVVILKIRFETASAGGDDATLFSEVWGGIPGIQVHPREEGHRLGQYYFDGLHINLIPVSGTEHSLMRFELKFYDENQQRLLLVEMIIIAKPTTQEGFRMANDYDVYNCKTFTSFQELMARMTSGQILVNLADDFPWIQDVLDRAKFAGIRAGHLAWYYAGAIMVNRDIVIDILRLDPLWKHHIPN